MHLPCRGAAATEELWFYWTRSLKSVGGGPCLLSHTLSAFTLTRHHHLLFLSLSCYFFWCVFTLLPPPPFPYVASLLPLSIPCTVFTLTYSSSSSSHSHVLFILLPCTPLALNTALVRRKMEAWTNPSLTQYVRTMKMVTRYSFLLQLKIWKPFSDFLTECFGCHQDKLVCHLSPFLEFERWSGLMKVHDEVSNFELVTTYLFAWHRH